MTHNQLKKTAEKYGLDLKYVTHWAPPNATDLRPLIAMPNVPKPLHGVAPRTVLGTTTWNKMRRECYEKANDTCEICGDCPDDKRKRQAHEVYVVNYSTGESVFIGCVCLCQQCHLACIHNGRAITLYSKKSPLITAD